MSPERDRYASAKAGPAVELRVLGSRFLARAFPLDAEGSRNELLEQQRRLHHDATHHCWALRMGPPEAGSGRWGEAGEPAGTAGPPILAAMEQADLWDVLVVVTRWFGGTKLGTGGLARAYREAARAALRAAPRRTVLVVTTLLVACSYEDLGAVEAVLARRPGAVQEVERTFDQQPGLVVRVLAGDAEELAVALREATGGRARVSAGEERRGAGEA